MADAITPRCGGAASLAVAVPHMDDGIVSEILHRLPTRDAYRLAAVCPRWRAVLYQPTFLSRHLSSRPPPLLGDRPYALVVQPRGGVGFTHLTLVAFDPADDRVPVNIPVQPKYLNCPNLLDTAGEDSVFRLLYSTTAGDPAPDATNDDGDDEEGVETLSAGAPDLPAVSSDPTTTTIHVNGAAEDDPALAPPLEVQVEVEDYVVFFERTVPKLRISVAASHGRLLLGRSRSRFYVCNPAANRWLALPPSSIAPDSVDNSGLHYDVVEASTGRLAFTVVLLVRRRRRRMLVETFSSATGMWEARELHAQGAARCLGPASPGIHVGTSFYWLSRRWGRILRYDAARGRASVLREPPEAHQSKGRVGRSLGSVGGGARLRLCAFDIRECPHEDLEGVHGVWVMDDGGEPASPARQPSSWRRVHEAVVGDIWWYFSSMLQNRETPVDFAGACGEFIVVDKFHRLLRHDLDSGSMAGLGSLDARHRRLGALYKRYHVFPFFK